MNRALHIVNSIGICIVVALCVTQWHHIAGINADRDRLELTRQAQAKLIDEQKKTIADQAADLDDFRKRLEMAEGQLKSLQQKLTVAESERDQLREALTKWKAAVAARDATIKQASEDIESLVGQRNTAIAQFNDVATKYNELIKKMSQ